MSTAGPGFDKPPERVRRILEAAVRVLTSRMPSSGQPQLRVGVRARQNRNQE